MIATFWPEGVHVKSGEVWGTVWQPYASFFVQQNNTCATKTYHHAVRNYILADVSVQALRREPDQTPSHHFTSCKESGTSKLAPR